MKNLFSNMHSNSCIYDNNYDLNYYMLYNNRFKFNMPPPLMIAPCMSSNNAFIPCDSNSSCNSNQVNKVFSADRGDKFSVSSKMNADSGSSGTYIAVKDTEK